MTTRSRFIPLFAAALLLLAALALRFFWSTPELAPSPAGEPLAVEASTAPAPVPVAPAPAQGKSEPMMVEAPPRGAELKAATVVPVGPGDEVPQLPVDQVSSEPNAPILPEKPQT